MIILALGKTGTGKSTLLHDLVRVQWQNRRYLVSDNEFAWGQVNDQGKEILHWRGAPPPLGPDFPTIADFHLWMHSKEPKYRMWLIRGEKEFDFWSALPRAQWPVEGVWVFQGIDKHEIVRLGVAKGDCTYVDDEIDLFAIYKQWDANPLRDFCHRGRHLIAEDGSVCAGHILGACRRPQSLHIDLTTLADEVYVFRQQGWATINRLVKDSTIPTGECPCCGVEYETLVQTLPDFEFLHYPSNSHLSIEKIGSARNTAGWK